MEEDNVNVAVDIDDEGPRKTAAVEPLPTKSEETKAPHFSTVLGVDFGSTKLSISLFRASGESLFPVLVANELANRQTPAVVVFDAKSRLMGEPADLVKNRGGAITTVKGNMISGTKVPVQLNDAAAVLDPVHVASMLLERLLVDVDRLEAANNQSGNRTRRAVLSVPPGLSISTIKSINQAAILAGYDVLSTVYDISCASLVYTHRAALALAAEQEARAKNKKAAAEPAPAATESSGNVVFLDMGHDWASAQVCFVDPAVRFLRILATDSKAGCGAAAFGDTLVSVWKQELLQKHKINVDALPEKQRERATMRLQSQAEKAKNMLSGLPEVAVVVDSVVPDLDLKTKVTRAAMESACQHVLDGITALLSGVVAAAGLTLADVSRVEIVGGGSRIPSVQALVKTVFGESKLFKTLDSECTQSYGAALFGGIAGGDGFLRFTVNGKAGPTKEEIDAQVGLSEGDLEAIRSLETQMRLSDLEVKKKNDAKNMLEMFVFDTRRDATEITAGVDAEDALDQLRGMLSTYEEWIYSAEGEEADGAGILAKLEECKKEAQQLAPKLWETLCKRDEKRRQEMMEAQQLPEVAKGAKKSKVHLRPSEKIADAKAKKEHGNTLYKENNTEDASKRYIQALGICAEMDGTLNPSDQAEVNEIKMGCYLNLVLCNIKMKLPKLAFHNANKAIEVDKENAKAYLRRAQALMETKDFEDAKKDILIAQKLDPEDKLNLTKVLAQAEKGIAAEKEKQKKAFGRMFASKPEAKEAATQETEKKDAASE